MNFYNKHFLNDFCLKKYELLTLIEINTKKKIFNFFEENVCIINEKQSLRTINSLINVFNHFNIKFTLINNIHNFKKENIKDFSKTLGLLYSYVFYRGNNDFLLKIISKYSGSVILNLLSNNFHPFQSISDVSFFKNEIIYIWGDFNSNVFKSIIINTLKINKTIIIFSPKKYWNYIFLKKIFSKKKIIVTEKIIFLKKKIFFYNDVWYSMGELNNFQNKIKKLINYQINKNILKFFKLKKILHCLPSYKNIKIKKIFFKSEIEENVFESKFSIFEKQIIKKISFLKTYLLLCKKMFFNII